MSQISNNNNIEAADFHPTSLARRSINNNDLNQLYAVAEKMVVAENNMSQEQEQSSISYANIKAANSEANLRASAELDGTLTEEVSRT